MNEVIPREAEEKEFDIDGFLLKRQEFIEKVNAIMVVGKDYHIIQDRKSMAKGGAEKIASIFGWAADFAKDDQTWEMLGKQVGTLVYVCRLSKAGAVVGEGRGAATMGKNGNDANKTIKMAQKSAFIDAVLRTSGLSDFFTQDLEDMAEFRGDAPAEDRPKVNPKFADALATKAQKDLIAKLMDEKGITKLSDVGFEQKEVTKGYAKEIIDFLLAYRKPQKAVPGIGDNFEIQIEESDLPPR